MSNTDVLQAPSEFYDAYVFDMDGTIYLGDHLLPGAARMINELRRRDIPIRYLSNNPTKDPEMYARKLTKLGLPTPVEDISNTIVTTTKWLKAHHPDAVLFPISEEPLKRALVKAGFGQRRKTLRRSLSSLVDDEAFVAAGVSPSARAEELDVVAWCRLAAAVRNKAESALS